MKNDEYGAITLKLTAWLCLLIGCSVLGAFIGPKFTNYVSKILYRAEYAM